jgi:NodT family efflux transporter outer membrane factor (OMF) lipoprotein
VDARRNVLVTVVAEVAHDYILLRGLQVQLALTYDNLKSQQDTLELTKSRFNAGLTSDLDVANAQAQVSTTAAQVPTLEIQIRQTMHQIAILLGQEPMALQEELGQKGIIPPSPSEIPVGLPSELLRRRPDVRQAERSLQAATANIGVAVAELFPRFSLTGTLGQQSGKFSLIARADSTYWSIGPSVTWRILDFGNLRNQIRVSNALQEQALLTYKKTVLQSFGDVEDALVAYAEDQKRTHALNDSVAANQRAVDLSQQLYARGLGDFLNVLTAERNLYAAQNDATISQTNVSTDLVQLYKALGGGWDENNEEQFHANEEPGRKVVQE